LALDAPATGHAGDGGAQIALEVWAHADMSTVPAMRRYIPELGTPDYPSPMAVAV
jgi:hypothetical protein